MVLVCFSLGSLVFCFLFFRGFLGQSSCLKHVTKPLKGASAASVRQDCAFDPQEFAPLLARLSFEAQKPILARFGFDVSLQGVQEMRAAVQQQSASHQELQALSERVRQALYGSPELRMYERVKLLLS